MPSPPLLPFLDELAPEVAGAFATALQAAERFRGATAPNPTVGCVLLDRDGATLALAAHEAAGRPHAEAAALALCRAGGTLDRVHTAVVTLEPCNHWGRTPPCSEALLHSPVETVWFGTPDINPRAEGGAARLRAAGRQAIDLSSLASPDAVALAAACRALVAPFAKRMLQGRPWVTVKQALDRAGSMIPPPGRKTFTSPAALTFAHRLRRRADAILTGSGTILADDPSLTVRHVPDHPGKRRPLVVLDRRGRVSGPYGERAALRGLDLRIEQDIEAALDRLGRDGMLEVLVEAGPALTGSILDAGLWDEHVLIRQDESWCEVVSRAGMAVRRIDFTDASGD